MTLRCLLPAAIALALAAPGSAVRLVQVMASPFEGLHSRFEVTVYLDRPGEVIDLRLVEMPEDGAEHEVACWRVADSSKQAVGGTCPSLPDDELAGGTLVVEILRSLPLARYRIEATGADGVAEASEIFDTRTFPAILARRLAPARSGGVPVSVGLLRGDPGVIDGVSGVRRVDAEARTQGMGIAIELAPASKEGFVFDLLGPDGLVWSKASAEPKVGYDGPPLAPGKYFWLVRSADPETILTLAELPRLYVVDEGMP